MPSNRYFHAFKENANTIGLAAIAALSAATLNPLPLLAGVVAEVAYLLIVPDTKWYAARLAKRFDAEVEQRRQKIKDQTLPTLRPEMQDRFNRLEETRRQIDVQSQDDQTWFREVLRKLDYLLEKFLFLAAKEAQFRGYLSSLRDEMHGVSKRERSSNPDFGDLLGENRRSKRPSDDVPRRTLRIERGGQSESPSGDSSDEWVRRTVEEVQAHYAQECERLQQMVQTEQDIDTKAVLEKRASVLQRRQEFVVKIGKILTNINHQLQLLEDTFGLINDEIRARSPEQILADIEEVVVATDTMSTTLEELASYEQIARAIG